MFEDGPKPKCPNKYALEKVVRRGISFEGLSLYIKGY